LYVPAPTGVCRVHWVGGGVSDAAAAAISRGVCWGRLWAGQVVVGCVSIKGVLTQICRT
jgi:hypothetical protein